MWWLYARQLWIVSRTTWIWQLCITVMLKHILYIVLTFLWFGGASELEGIRILRSRSRYMASVNEQTSIIWSFTSSSVLFEALFFRALCVVKWWRCDKGAEWVSKHSIIFKDVLMYCIFGPSHGCLAEALCVCALLHVQLLVWDIHCHFRLNQGLSGNWGVRI